MGNSRLDIAQSYLAALEKGDPDAAGAHFADDILQVEYPNRLKPKGDRRDRAALIADSKKGAGLLSRQSYEICRAVEDGETLALEVYWEGVLAIPLAGMAAGDKMVTYSAMFLTFRGDKIISQHNYDCFPPFGE